MYFSVLSKQNYSWLRHHIIVFLIIIIISYTIHSPVLVCNFLPCFIRHFCVFIIIIIIIIRIRIRIAL
jgi:hypothetical protein